MKRKMYKKCSACLLTLALLVTSSINSFIVYAEETSNAIQEVEEEIKTQEQEMEKDIPAKIVTPVTNNLLKNSLLEANNNAGAFAVTGGADNTDWTYSNNVLTFNTSGNYSVTGDGNVTKDRIVVAANFEGTITIKNVNIDVSEIDRTCAFEVHNTAKLTLMLEGNNTLKSGSQSAGLVFAGAITGTLEIGSNANGSLVATGGVRSAGIGSSGRTIPGNNITISGGTVTATGGHHGAGIGGGERGSGNNITISGGTVIATGGIDGAGIGGGGRGGSGNNITISGGTVIATGDIDGAGIGGGERGSGNNITISGGTVTATAGATGGAGIGGGGGRGGSGNNITISGGTVTATAGATGGAGIGGGWRGSGNNIVINRGSVKASSISITPTNSTGKELYLAKLDNQDGTSSVILDETDHKIAGNHPDDSSFYLYLTGEDHNLKYEKGTAVVKRIVKWDETNKTFTFTKLPSITPNLESDQITGASITIKPLADTNIYGKAQYSLDNSNWQDSNIFTGLTELKEYTIYAKYLGNDSYNESAPNQITVQTLLSDIKILEKTKLLAEDAIKEFQATNDTTKEDVVQAISTAIASENGVSVTLKTDPTIKKETWMQEGSVKGILVLQYKQESIEITFDKVIERSEPIIYDIIDNEDIQWELGSKEGCTFKVDVDISTLVGIQVNDKTIDESFYTREVESAIITLKPEYLNTLKIGNYKVNALFEEGYSKVKLTIKEASTPIDPGDSNETDKPDEANKPNETDNTDKPNEKNNGVDTGDTSNMILYFELVIISGCILAFTLKRFINQKSN